MAGTGAVPLFRCLLGSDDDKAKHNDPKMDERQTFKLFIALVRRRLPHRASQEFVPRKGLIASWSCRSRFMYGKLAYMYGKIGYFEYFHGLRKQNLPLDVWQLGFLAAGCACFNLGVSIREAQV